MTQHVTACNFHYNTLSAPDSLRLLRVLPKKLNGCIQIHLWEPTKVVPYRCLSYTWGDQTEKYSILVNGRQMEVGRNLYTFLELAQLKFPAKSLWIDAICINQSDFEEKSLQVQRMGIIFSRALEVVIWLGNEQVIGKLFDLVLQPQNVLNDHIHDYGFEHLDLALEEFSNHPYWSRAWITQEIMLAERLILLCGVFEIGVHTLEMYLNDLWHRKWGHLPDEKEDITGSAGRIMTIFITLIRKRKMPEEIWELVQDRKDTQCKDPRDRLYSLLAVTGHDATFKVDYNESLVDLYMRSLYYFSAWMDFLQTSRLWSLLHLDVDTITAHVQKQGQSVLLAMPMRPSKLQESIRRQLPHALIGTRVGQCANDSSNARRCQIIRFSSNDILLCPKTSGPRKDKHNVHLLIKRSSSGSADFTLYMHSHKYGRILCPADTEIWHTSNDVERKVDSWVELSRLCGSARAEDADWKTKPHFLVKLSHQYLIAVTEHYYAMREMYRWKRKS